MWSRAIRQSWVVFTACASAPIFQLPANASLGEEKPHAHACMQCIAQHVLHKSETHQTSNLENVETSQRKPRLKGPIRCAVCPQLGASLRRVCVQDRSTKCDTHMPRRSPAGCKKRRTTPFFNLPSTITTISCRIFLTRSSEHCSQPQRTGQGSQIQRTGQGSHRRYTESAQTKADPHNTHVYRPRLAKALPAMLDSVP